MEPAALSATQSASWLRTIVRWVVVAGATLLILFLLLVCAVRFIVVPRIDDFRGTITTMIGDSIGRTVSIGEINAGWDGWSPTLSLVDFKLMDAAGNPALTLPRIETAVLWRSIVSGEIRLRRIEVNGPQLVIRRDAAGRFYVGGMDVDQPARADDNTAAEWFARQRQVVIRDGTLLWQDDLRGAPPLRLEQVNLLLENSGHRHRFGFTAVPPAALAAPVDLRGEFAMPSLSEWQRAEGQLYARVDFVDAAQAKTWVPLPFDLKSGRGALRSWLAFVAGEPRDVTLDVELDDLRTRLRSNLPELDVAHVTGRLAWRRDDGRTDVSTRALTLTTKNGASLTPGDITIRYTAASGDKPASGEFKSTHLQLEPLLALVQYLPVDDKLRAKLAKLAPVGILDVASFTWTGELDKLADYQVRSQFRDIGVTAFETFPGVTRLSGDVDASSKSGTLNIVADGARLTLPRVFAAPIDLDAASAHVTWKIADQIAVRIHKLSFANADAAGTVQGEYRTLANGPGWSDLNGTIARAKATSVHKYLPIILAPSVRNWLREALLAGTASEGRFVVKGNLYDFPWVDNKGGAFLVTAKAADAALDYADRWPKIENIKADVRFEGAKMVIAASEATTVGLALSKVQVEIPHMGVDTPHVVIRGEGGGSAEGFLQYIDQSPVGGWIGHFTQGAKALGNGQLKLGLDVPLGQYEQTKINGEYAFANNTIQLGPEIPRADKASGKFVFTERDFRSQDVVAEALGGTANVQVSVADSKVRVALAGTADMNEVRKLYPFPLAERARGRTDWQFSLQADGASYAWSVETGLRGVTIDLPAPLAKKPEASLPLRVERQGIDKTHDRLVASLGPIAQMEAIRLLTDRGTEVQKMAFSLGRTPAKAEREGLWIRGNVDNIEVEPWLAIAGAMAGSDKGTAGAAPPVTTSDIAFAGIDVNAESSVLFGRKLRNVHVEAQNQGGSWKIDLDSDDIAGAVTWQPTKTGDSGLIVARLKKLALPPEEAASAPTPAGAQPARKELPALDVIAESYVSKGKDLGRLELKARRGGTDWIIDSLALRNPEGDLIASGRWRGTGANSRTDVDIKLDVRDVAKFLARHGVPEGVRGGTGKLDGHLSWAGGPQDFNYPTLTGQLQLDVRRGWFTKVEPGIGKLLGVLNLEALARRTFDFKDVVMAEGYAFDEMTAHIAVKNGVMSTSDLRINGPSAKVDIAGNADIAKETQHLKVRVQPAISGGLAAAAAAVNPLVGAGVLLGSTILRDPLGKIFAGEYDVTGTWVDPKVEKLAAVSKVEPSEASR